ncbi:uncharacterized protein BDW43DRAFT_323398 [Aspergillus alliaceus]|uniref:uncharacterized protein n=1 Tax=Petromyces alliaceus TaxID=209559 RepID=UPI0012A54466|nr:uncharacterized protein BDW43DRAFT_323398 [Aspergillus alliaceus]KAB8227934.1 hypothetical protein BDW43DRAFT_323398 [Aspergillus alliaceus]
MESSRQCVICSGGICQADWTKDFNTVFLEGNHIELGFLRFNKNVSLQESRSLTTHDKRTQIRLNPSPYFTSVEVFLIHTSCYHLLCEFAGSKIRSHQVFKLCQAIQPDRERNFGHDLKINPSICPDPFISIRPQKCLPQSEETVLLLQPATARCCVPFLLRLPSEVLTIIFEHLSPSDLVRFFCTSKEALSYANLFCRTNPFHFYRCSANTAGIKEDKRILMIAFSVWARLCELDRRWEIVRRVAGIAKLVPFLSDKSSALSTFDPRAPLRAVNHQFGLCENLLDIPDHASTIEVCSIRLDGKCYVCGIGFVSRKSRLFFGNRTESLCQIDVSNTTIETIELAVDALGIRSIKFGISPWLFGDPAFNCCWGGISLRRNRTRIRIIRDALKLRDLSWHQMTPPSFEETILMKDKHPSLSSHWFIAEEHYVQQHPERERELVDRFGKFPVEALRFERDLQAIQIYGTGGLNGILGLSVQILSRTYCVGACHIVPASITLHAPHEILTEIDVRASELYPLAVTFRTNYNRELSSEPNGLLELGVRYSIRTLRPPQGYRITGLFFRLEGLTIDSIGLILGSS